MSEFWCFCCILFLTILSFWSLACFCLFGKSLQTPWRWGSLLSCRLLSAAPCKMERLGGGCRGVLGKCRTFAGEYRGIMGGHRCIMGGRRSIMGGHGYYGLTQVHYGRTVHGGCDREKWVPAVNVYEFHIFPGFLTARQ